MPEARLAPVLRRLLGRAVRRLAEPLVGASVSRLGEETASLRDELEQAQARIDRLSGLVEQLDALLRDRTE